MKYLVLLCDGMADHPAEKLGGKTPMQAAQKPNMDALAKVSEVGMCNDGGRRNEAGQRCCQSCGNGLRCY